MRHMTGNRLLAACAALAILIPLIALAQGASDLPQLEVRSFSRDFGGRAVACDIVARAGGELAPGKRLALQLDLNSTITGGQPDELASAVVLNGLVAVALPPGIEPEGQLRLFYFDEAKGSYQFMYSKDFPKLERLLPVQEAMQLTTGSDPKSIFAGLSQISTALDPAVTPRGPADSRTIGGNASYAVSGISWLIPCSVFFDELVNPFDPQDSLGRGARIRVNVPLKVTQAVADPRVAVYVGGLSTAVAKVELLPAEIPPTALPLAPLPEPAPAPAADGNAPTAPPPAQPATPGEQPPPPDEPGTQPSGNDSGGRSTPIMRPEGQDEAPAAPAQPAGAEAQTPPPPARIPTLIYSYEWVVWETEIDLSSLAPEGSTAPRFAIQDQTGVPQVESPAVEVEPPPAGETPVPAELAPAMPEIPAAPPQEPDDAAAPAEPAAEVAPLTPQEDTQVREVKPETLEQGDKLFTVPLKEITGSGAGPASAAAGNVADGSAANTPDSAGGEPAADTMPPPEGLGEMVLIPEGYFLMGTGGAASAGDADELPQAQVYLPAYYIDKYPVTNRQFMEFVLRAGYKPEGDWQEYYSPASADLPVRAVSWNDAAAYAKWARKRLPTEAEWEKAARGEDGRTYPWGEDWSAEILPRGAMTYDLVTAANAASPYGVMALVGVLWQWTASAFAPYPYDPNARGEKYVLRGGCYNNGRNIIRCANRYAEPPNVRFNTFTFRCVKDAT